jgi:lipoprotein-releasing system permease protein
MLKFFLWLRYLRKKKIVFLSIAAVALVVSLLIVVASLFTGFIKVFEQSAVKAMGDVVLEPPMRFAKYPLLIEKLEQIHAVEAATGVLSAQGLLLVGRGNVRLVSIRGIEPGRQDKVTDFQRSLITQSTSSSEPSFKVPGFPDEIGGFVGIGVLTEPDEQTDEYDFASAEQMIGLQVVLTTGTVSKDQFVRKVIQFGIADIVFTGVYELDKGFIYLPIGEMQKKLYPDKEGQIASQIQIKLAGDAETKSALAQIRGVWRVFADEQLNWSPYLINDATTITTSKELQSRYVEELRKQMRILLFIFGVVDCSVVLLIICIFYMIVRLKQKDIAIIKSCGATSGSVCWIFVAFGFCVGIIGSVFGTLLGYLVTKNVNGIEEFIRRISGLKLWKSSVYMFSEIPNEVNWSWALAIVLIAIGAAVVGTLIPAIVAARTRPVDILRYE